MLDLVSETNVGQSGALESWHKTLQLGWHSFKILLFVYLFILIFYLIFILKNCFLQKLKKKKTVNKKCFDEFGKT